MDEPVKIYDVAIIGGGLSGLALAIKSAEAGFSTILFEKENYPFHKVCGEFISMESWNYLSSLGIRLEQWELPIINKLCVTDTKGTPFGFPLPMGGFGISRYHLDNALYEIALNKGVIVQTNTKVKEVNFHGNGFHLQTAKGKYAARVAAGCFGKRSNLDIKWERPFSVSRPNKLNNLIAVKYHIKYPHPPDTISLHNFPGGYCGISRIENGVSCLCYLSTAENLRKSGNSIPAMEKNILFVNSELKKILVKATHLYEQPVTISQISFQQKSQVENHVLLLGDAAGMITPLCGNGMSMALHASKMAFSNIQPFLNNQQNREEMELSYQKEWQKQFGRRTLVGRVVQYFFGGTWTSALFLRVMHAFPKFSSKLIALTHGQPF